MAVRTDTTAPLAFISKGTGRAVLLLHGQAGAATAWFRLRPLLAGAGYRGIAVDRPGYGQTGGRPSGFASNARSAFELLDYLDIADITVVGHSWAGGVALAMALQQPQRVSGLVLQGSVGGTGSITWFDRTLAAPALGAGAYAVGLRMAALGLSISGIRRRMAPELHDLPHHRLAAIAAAWSRAGTARTVAHEQRTLIHELPVIQAQLPRVDTPAVVLIGSSDRLVRPESQRDLARRLPDAEAVEVDGGHFLAVESPETLVDAVERVARAG